ncbi:conserved Plasmodium protein, unknown function [Plasmodium knowlesi strain H]|uniref:Uncharacterized protein n=3 Tax=Plasmodium knowlesi TaxID=5850 RepID=A0A5K1VDN9_PLAKH|nr:conserved Plasmodium protein, unknown function [Plasmodium knowlesi strain H]OTN64443.1 Uncharacterized protein PKNOH_S130210400 [Plasmodium knowlesi]CAA9989265.1 conserved Plasmodium protein, unknown function [Plasmodium knowlesi strain H]SBO26159.1 conserved Plasmodium protein, unknown function [Plasmodium knowlesi strain H]SBO26923.1 conserved Plasmodium protein, unknown function [Plasmodium knowlesi strain H]VVS78739.1 conserved Plasmodium protein, unknown function [Plasmodium knowlesi |eukprot:XP_002261611.1 hypothetical protein, conserved in Plasmodium species [Plasmodium knowlesi strain H]
MNLEKKVTFYKNELRQRDEEDQARFKKAVNFQNNFSDMFDEFVKRKDLYKLQEEIKNYKHKMAELQNENGSLKGKVQLCYAEVKKLKEEIRAKDKRIIRLMAENDVADKLCREICLRAHPHR